MEINEVVCYLSYIEEDCGQIYALIEVEISLTAEITYRDEDTSYYDKEDYFLQYKKHLTLMMR